MSFIFDCEFPMGKSLVVRRYHLPNGLTLISLADSSAPIIAYQSWYGVGSKHEAIGATGMAHFFEHLMFNQTKSMPVGEFDKRIESIGGDTNAATWVDWTYYRNSVPSKNLELIVALEAERMTDLVLEKSSVEAEREVVLNERGQRVDDDVDGFASEALFREAFETHPYRWPTIGWQKDIKALSIPDMLTFYRRFYSPDNATIVVVGDFEEKKLLDLIQSHYGHIPASGHKRPLLQQEAKQEQERSFSYTKEVSSPRLLNGYKAPGQGHPDWPAVYFCCQWLAANASSPLYKQLVIESEIASSISCEVMPFTDPNLIEIAATVIPPHSLDFLQAQIDSLLSSLATKTILESEIQKIKNLVETEFWTGLTTADGKAEALGHYQTGHGDFRELFAMEKRLSAVNAADIQRVLHTYFRPAQRTIIRIVPQEDSKA